MRSLYRIILGLLLCIVPVTTNAQATDTLQITTPDTTRYNPGIPMLSEYSRPPIYDRWFKQIAACEGLPLPPQSEIDKITYVVVNSDRFSSDSTGVLYDAVMLNRKYLMIVRLPSVWDYDVIAHEFLHFILWYQYGTKYEVSPNIHPSQYFSRCNIRPN